MQLENIKKIAIVGSGTMGCEIGLACAIEGLEVILFDVAPSHLQTTMTRIESLAGWMQQNGMINTDLKPILARLECTDDIHAVADADLVSESVYEDNSCVNTSIESKRITS